MKGNGESLEWKLFLASFPLCPRAVAQNPLAAQRSQIVWGPTTPVGVRRLLRIRCDDLLKQIPSRGTAFRVAAFEPTALDLC